MEMCPHSGHTQYGSNTWFERSFCRFGGPTAICDGSRKDWQRCAEEEEREYRKRQEQPVRKG